MNTYKVVITRRVPPPAVEMLAQAGFAVDLIDQDNPPTPEELLQRARGAAGLITMLSERIDAALLDAAGPDLRVVANFAVGFDNIDLAACTQRGVRATNTPGVLTDATADLAWTLILATARRVVEGDRLVRAGEWTGWAPMQYLGLQLSGATLGIVGAGRIGTAVGLRSSGFGLNVLYADEQPNRELEEQVGARRVELGQLIADADVLTLHVPLTSRTRHLIGAEQLAAMKPTAILINTARGPVVDEKALVEALRSGQIAAAGFDVYEHEPRLAPGLTELPNVVVLPHLGSATTATRRKMSQMTAENVIAVLTEQEPPNPVN
ncbi:MAG: D-glycerate dehydrogenase [Phycisphaerae bacterium]|nr:D-glycerate dehydrogenase [Phycisphaerae bacterium]